MSRGRPRLRNACENLQSIDVRQLHRQGRLLTYQSFPLSWKCGDEPWGDINVRTERNRIDLHFRCKRADSSDWKLVEQSLPIVWTACALGGRRPWFLCTAASFGARCGRRVAKIYLGASLIFACRHCYGLAYTSQFESSFHRDIAKAMKIRMQLGGSPSLFDPFPNKPKGLHWSTYERLRNKHDASERRLP
jgi:hypothetical protein